MPAGVSGTRCDGCLGSLECWVCLGTGLVEARTTGIFACHRCYGSGRCSLCQPISVTDVGRTPPLRVPR